MTEKTKPETPANTMPERIWLQSGKDENGDRPDEITWCSDPIAEGDEEYIRADVAEARVVAVEMERDRLREALTKIEKWSDFPVTGRYWDEDSKTRPMSYGACYGTNGERNYMRGVARAAIESTQSEANHE